MEYVRNKLIILIPIIKQVKYIQFNTKYHTKMLKLHIKLPPLKLNLKG